MSASEINARQEDTQNPAETTGTKIKEFHISVFFDGTGNNETKKLKELYAGNKKPARRAIHQGGFSNIAILYQLLRDRKNTDEKCYYNLYVEGSGTNSFILDKNLNGLGFGLGNTGVTAKVKNAINLIRDYLLGFVSRIDKNTKFLFYIFGFSRGATCARVLAELVSRNEGETFNRESEFDDGSSEAKKLFKNDRIPFMEGNFLSDNVSINRENVTVEVLGIYDTVASIGNIMRIDGTYNEIGTLQGKWRTDFEGNFHYKNVWDYGLYSPRNKRVIKTCHICAADEFRENFALVNLGTSLTGNMTEIIIPGCHSDIGGGYGENVTDTDISIDKIPPRVKDDYETDKEDIRAKMFIGSHPSKSRWTDSSWLKLGASSMRSLGWIELKPAEDGEIPKSEYTYRYEDDGKTFEMKRKVVGWYSNIPLKMMLKFVKTKAAGEGTTLFNDESNPYKIDEELRPLGNKLVNLIGEKSTMGKRIWFLPKEGNIGEYYRWLRLHYLHFSGSNKIYKLGNFINYDSEGRICRITYDGDKQEYEEDNFAKSIKYMYDLKCETPDLNVDIPSK